MCWLGLGYFSATMRKALLLLSILELRVLTYFSGHSVPNPSKQCIIYCGPVEDKPWNCDVHEHCMFGFHSTLQWCAVL